MNDLLKFANDEYNHIQKNCQKLEDCSSCLSNSYYSNDAESYDCEKLAACYVMRYGPAYASEVYNFLEASSFLENNFTAKGISRINMLSLGCGFCPDWYGFTKYINDKNLNLGLTYTGMDSSKEWQKYQNPLVQNGKITICPNDITTTRICQIGNYDIIMLQKLFSTLKAAGRDEDFLKLLSGYVPLMKVGSFLIFIDVNNQYEGRDDFDESLKKVLKPCEKYRFAVENSYTPFYDDHWIDINNLNIRFQPSSLLGLSVDVISQVRKSVVFVYQKV